MEGENNKSIYFLTPIFYREFINGEFNKENMDRLYEEFINDSKSKSFIIKYMDMIINFDRISTNDKIKVLFFISSVIDNEIIFIREENPNIIQFF